jgi:hypothetical protein
MLNHSLNPQDEGYGQVRSQINECTGAGCGCAFPTRNRGLKIPGLKMAGSCEGADINADLTP